MNNNIDWKRRALDAEQKYNRLMWVVMIATVLTIAIIVALAITNAAIKYKYDHLIVDHVEYVVRSGDTLWSISKEYLPVYVETGIDDIAKANNLASSDIYPGQKILLPVYLKQKVQ